MIHRHHRDDHDHHRGCAYGCVSLGVLAIGLAPLAGRDWTSCVLAGALAFALGLVLFWRSA